MKRRAAGVAVAVGVLASLMWVRGGLAQARRPAPGPGRRAAEADALHAPDDIAKVRQLDGVGKHYQLRTPEYRTSLSGGTKRPGEWAEIKVLFDTYPDWIDELVVQFYVLTESKDKGKELYSFFKTTVRYLDVEKGQSHAGAVYLPPNAVKRYGLPVAIAVELIVGDKTVASETEFEKRVKLPEQQWWKSNNVLGNQNVTVRNEYLVSRRQSPFALIAMDDYESER
jgi:hypothetical protein